MIKKKISIAAALAVMALSVGAPVAGAQTAAQSGYDESGVLGSVDTPGGEGPSAVQAVSNNGGGDSSLPFTGLDVGILLVLGGAAAGTGFALRRVARQPAA
jgi:hypothetical protein